MWIQAFPSRQVGRQTDTDNYWLSYIFHKGNASSICFESIDQRDFFKRLIFCLHSVFVIPGPGKKPDALLWSQVFPENIK